MLLMFLCILNTFLNANKIQQKREIILFALRIEYRIVMSAFLKSPTKVWYSLRV